ncbi:MAG: type II secretion system protein [Terracidiphilus sp.]|jgi:type II secretory pathway pseudopilin PulG
MMKLAPTRRQKPSEEGYVLVAVICMVALFTIALAVALPRVSKEIQRDRELETMHRGKQYARGVKLYYKKFGAYPPSVDALLKTNNIRFLRKKYTDPTTGKEDWKPVRFGQNKAPTAMGFFGVPLGGSTIAGTGPSGGNGLPGGIGSGGSNPTGASSFFNQPAATPDPNAAQTTDPNSSSGGTQTGTTGTTTGTTGSTFGSTTGSSSGTGTGTGTGLSGQTFGGAGIIGFSPNSPKQSIMVYKKKNHYNEWEFVYDPLAEQMMLQGGNAGGIGQPASNTTTPVGSTSSTGTTSTTSTTSTSTTQ